MEEWEAHKKMEEKLEVDFTDKDLEKHDKVLEVFNIPKDKEVVSDMNEKIIESLQKRFNERQLGFYAFLNKEFNVMNFKSARCSKHCFDDESVKLAEVNHCLDQCRKGIEGCRDFAMGLQKQAQSDLEDCHQKAQDVKVLSDPVVHYASCYEKLIKRFDLIEKDIADEFANFI